MKNIAMINKATLKAICERKKVSSTYLAKETYNTEQKIVSWINPSDPARPSILQAKEIAKCLHIPFAALYMNPEDIPLKQLPIIRNMRSLYNSTISDDSSLNIAILDLLSERNFLVSTSSGLGEEIQPFSLPFNSQNGDASSWASEIRRVFDLRLNEQFGHKSARQFYLYLRSKVEQKGIFIHCFTDVDIEISRGVAIYEDTLPIIGINAKDRHPAKSFSIIHELVHIIKRQSSMCNDMYNSFTKQQEEVFCNAVAGEVLIPWDALKVVLRQWHSDYILSVEDIDSIAKQFSVSKEVTIRRLYDNGRISENEYYTYAAEFDTILQRNREEQRLARKEGRPTSFPIQPNIVAVDKTSPAICINLYRGYTEEMLSKQDVARYLGIGQQYVDKFFGEVSSWSAN